ncbi:hypothetical protein [Desulfurispora thermophila]|uniref:hypothetical protein n=1 Tax=Desulfurispora thermophila TaxID=265470 RepID=UPI0012E9B39B|nr:hypothetical protein [Desulfurispora thermophila]
MQPVIFAAAGCKSWQRALEIHARGVPVAFATMDGQAVQAALGLSRLVPIYFYESG